VAKARTRARPPGRRGPSGKQTSRSSKSTAKRSRTTVAAERVTASSKQALAPHRRDIQGVALLVFSILLAMAVWWHVAGLGMRWADVLLRGMFGYGAYGLPVLAATLGVIVLRNRDPLDEPVAGRVVIGGLAILLGGVGLLHLAKGAPPMSAGVLTLQESGGFVGALTAEPLARLLSPWGAGAILLAVEFLGLLITTKTPVAAIGRTLSTAMRWASDLFRQVHADLAGRTGAEVEEDADILPGGGLAGAVRQTPPELEPPADKPTRRRPRDRSELDDAEQTVTVERVAPAAPLAGVVDAPSRPAGPPPPPPEPGGPYALPPPTLLHQSKSRPVDARRLDETAQTLENTLDQFEVDARVARYTRGPTVTRYEVELGPATKVQRVVGLAHDIAYALASPDVRIIAPIPGKSAIGIEVPNRDRELVTMGDILTRTGDDGAHPLTVALGKDIGGEPVLANLADMPHVLIAGSTGAGKSVCLNVLVTSLLMRNPPDRVRLILIDPKRVELTNYEGVPHLITPVVTHPKRAAEALSWAVREMEMRLETLALAGMRNIAAYNKAAEEGKLPPLPSTELDGDGRPAGEQPRPPMPFIVLVIDELADLMMIAPRDVEDAICRIAQMARAVGIHLVVATQRPSVDVVTGLIKANIPSRIAFMVASAQDSRVILDTGGADKLVGHGDMLFLPGGTSKPRRVQGAFITEKEVEEVVAFCKAQQGAHYQPGVVAEGRASSSEEDSDEDPLLTQAMEIIVRSGLGSTSMLQSKMKVGFSRARRIMDQLEERGVVGASEGSKPRDVLMTVEELEELRGREQAYGEMAGE
jgi:DNA segregation ATPase FtsK/SpoIIIE, S-DNA-T family